MIEMLSYFLWECIKSIPMSSDSIRYEDYSLRRILEKHGYSVTDIVVSNHVMVYMNIDDVHYLRVTVYFNDGRHDYMMHMRPFYEGTDDEWFDMMMDSHHDDIIVRFNISENKPEPLWTSTVKDSVVHPITGDTIDWAVLDSSEPFDDEFVCDDDDFSYYANGCDDLRELTLEALDPDYTFEDSDSDIWRII